MRSRIGIVAAAALAAAALCVPAAQSSRGLQVGLFDDTQILYGNPGLVFPVLKSLRTQVIRVNLYWGGPNGVARRRPANAANPLDRAYDWSTYDRTVNFASQYGMQVVFSIFATPAWANAAAGVNVAPRNALDLKKFAQAAAIRYNGRSLGYAGQPLASVRSWLVWNEPNNPVFLRPQYKRVAGKWRIQSAIDYAKMCNAAVQGIKLVTLGASKVACGVTGPRGNNNPSTNRASVAPIPFLRAMKAAGAKGFDAYAHHPYSGRTSETPSSAPPQGIHGNAPTAVTLGNLGAIVKEVNRLYGKKRIWITEYGYQTSPPERIFGVSLAKQALYLKQAYAIAKKNPQVDMLLWFLLRDEVRIEGWQSGLLTSAGKKKPSFAAFAKLHP